MKKTVMATMVLLLMGAAFSATALTAPVGPRPGVGMPESHRIHVSSGARMQTPVHNRVHMTSVYSVSGPVGGRMSSYRPAPVSGRVIVRPSLPPAYVRPVLVAPPPRWHRAGYYSGHYWRPYGYGGAVVIGYPAGYYGYPVVYPAGYYGYPYYSYGPAVRISVRL